MILSPFPTAPPRTARDSFDVKQLSRGSYYILKPSGWNLYTVFFAFYTVPEVIGDRIIQLRANCLTHLMLKWLEFHIKLLGNFD